MSFNGSGSYTPPGSSFPAVANTLIESAKFNAIINDIATALSTCVLKDGQQTITANIPLSGFKLTGVGAGTARTDAATLANIQDVTANYVGTVGGTADVITLTPAPAITAYAAGQTFSWIASGGNTTNVTVNVSAVGAKALTKNGTVALVAGDLPSGALITATYDGTRLQLVSALPRNYVATVGGTSDVITLTPTPAIAGYAAGQTFSWIASGANTTNVTVNVSGLGAKALTKNGATALISGDIQSGAMLTGTYDGTRFQLSGGVASSVSPIVNDLRLTLTTVVPVTTGDVTGATTIYCTPYKGNRISLYDGANWNTRTSAEFSLALGTLTSGLPYDVFCYDNAGVPTLEFLAWTNTTTRATALAYQNGVLSKSGALTRRYLGTFVTTSTTQTENSAANRYLQNYYNRVLYNGSTTFTADRTTTSATFVELNTEIRCNFVLGVSEDLVSASACGSHANSGANTQTGTGISFDSTTVAEPGFQFMINTANAGASDGFCISGLKIALAVGTHFSTVLGKVNANTGTWHSSLTAATAKIYLHLGIWG